MVGNSTMVLLPYLVTILRGGGYGLSLFCWGNLLLLFFSGKTWGNDIYIYIMIQFDDMIFFNLAGGPTCPRKVKAFERSSF